MTVKGIKNSVNALYVSAIGFDLDGTLIDTVPLIVESHRYALHSFPAYANDLHFIINSIGLPLEHVYNEARLGPSYQECMQAFLDYNVSRMNTHIGIFRGVIPMLEGLAAKGIPLALITAKRRAHAMMACDLFDITKYFTAFIGKEDTTRHKPDPTPLRLALQQLGVPDEKSMLYVGDAIHDVRAGKNLGGLTAVVAWSHTTKTELMAEHPDLWIDDVCQFVNHIEHLI